MASPLLEIKPKPDWAQHTAHRTRSRPSLIFRATAQHILRLGAMTCWRPPRPGLGGNLSQLRLEQPISACSQKT
jgi:hypothetical protein